MMATTALWNKFNAAKAAKNGGASLAYKNAIECANKDKEVDAAWWEKQGDIEMPTAVETSKV